MFWKAVNGESRKVVPVLIGMQEEKTLWWNVS
jgi:hypothetical protein